MRLTTSWTCPECGVAVKIPLDALSGADGTRLKIRIKVPDTALADVFAHAWTHHEGVAQ